MAGYVAYSLTGINYTLLNPYVDPDPDPDPDPGPDPNPNPVPDPDVTNPCYHQVISPTTTFDYMMQEIIGITNRPDLETETKSALKAATLKAHRSDFYSKDIHETGVEFPTKSYIQSLDYISLIPNLRSFKYFKTVENEYDTLGNPIDIVSSDMLFDSYNRQRTDVAYVAGRVLEIRSSVAFQYALLGCYVSPVITEVSYHSWVADLHPYAIIYEAARIIFKSIGYDEQAATFRELVADEYKELKMTGLADVGY